MGKGCKGAIIVANGPTLPSHSPTDLRVQLLKHTKCEIVNFLCVFPKTQHDLNSYVVDLWAHTVSTRFLSCRPRKSEVGMRFRRILRALITILSFQETMLCFSVNGVFKEGECM